MSLKTDIQTQITMAGQSGTFPSVTYDSSDLPVIGTNKAPGSVIANELSGGMSDSSRFGATSNQPVLRNWRWEMRLEFPCEVDVTYFLENELSLNFNLDSLLVSVIPSGDFQVEHPPRNASHNGTKLTVGLTVNTRR
jgi:hypothetical protein